jgi:uncharacterized protein YxeA
VIRKILDIVLTAIGYFFGKKHADLEHEKAHLKSLNDYETETKKKFQEVGRDYDKMLRDYDDHINGVSEARDLQTPNDKA